MLKTVHSADERVRNVAAGHTRRSFAVIMEGFRRGRCSASSHSEEMLLPAQLLAVAWASDVSLRRGEQQRGENAAIKTSPCQLNGQLSCHMVALTLSLGN